MTYRFCDEKRLLMEGAVGQRRESTKIQKRMIHVGQAGYNKVLNILAEPRSGAVTVQYFNTKHLMIWTYYMFQWPVNTHTYTHTHTPTHTLTGIRGERLLNKF